MQEHLVLEPNLVLSRGTAMPRTNTSIDDLDQAVTMRAGMTLLGFSLYDVASLQRLLSGTLLVQDPNHDAMPPYA